MEQLLETVDNPSVRLTSMTRKKHSSCRPSRLGPSGRNGVRDEHRLDDIDCKQADDDGNGVLNRSSHAYPSLQFLDVGYHYVLNDFPWKREELMRDLEADEGDKICSTATPVSATTSRGNSMLFSQFSRRSRIVSDGSEDVFEMEPGMSDVALSMEEELNDEQRRMQANLKWNLRRQKIEQEINRLRHYSINKSLAVAGGPTRFRHSVSFGDDLEIQLESSRMRVLEEVEEEEGETEQVEVVGVEGRVREKSFVGKRPMTLGPKSNITKTFIRSISMPGKDMNELLKPTSLPLEVPSLQTYIEEEEEEDEERVGRLGLPPKDIPMNLSGEDDWVPPTGDDDEVA